MACCEQKTELEVRLLKLLEIEGNTTCADCHGISPKWAAWNLGVFICMRCASMHRKLGVHVSKVKSVNLDSWTEDQVNAMERMGNRKAKQLFEFDLPEHFKRPTNANALEKFIRAKYEHKRYFHHQGSHATLSPEAMMSFAARHAPKSRLFRSENLLNFMKVL